MKKQKFKKDGRGGLFIGALVCVVAFAASLLLFSLLLSFFANPVSLLSISALLSFLVSAAAASFINAKRKGEGGTLSAILSSLLTSALFFAVGLIASRGKIELSLLMNILCYLLVSALFAKLASVKKKRHSRIRR